MDHSSPVAGRKSQGDISVLIAGEAGDGILFTSNVLAKVLKRHGWEALTCRDFPSNIRGEPSSSIIRASRRPLLGRPEKVDVILAFACGRCRQLVHSIKPGGVILCEGEEEAPCGQHPPATFSFYRFHMRKEARENFGSDLFKNMIVLGGLGYLFGLDQTVLDSVITEMFLKKKGRAVVDINLRAVALGYQKARELVPEEKRILLERKPDAGRLVLSGDEAIAFGALAAGCRFAAAYPICPASEIWQWLALNMPEFKGVVIQTEDELAALNMALGAAYTGARAMTATSGPGGSLMMEAFSLAGMAEIPVVIAHVQRVGPSTGTPTKTEQSDLNQWVFGGHGDFPRIILAPGTLQECFDFTLAAFNLAEMYQCPVVVLTEEDMGQNSRTTPDFDLGRVTIDRGRLLTERDLDGLADFKRYALTPDGISPRSLPSQKGGMHMVEGNEHDERGFRQEDAANRVRMIDKRMRKLETCRKDLPPPLLWGEDGADIGLVTIGSVLGAVLEAGEELGRRGHKAKILQIRTLWPFPGREVSEFLSACRRAFVVENNFSGQLHGLVRSQACPQLELGKVLNYSAQPFGPAEIIRAVLGERT
jgi:2-oxoglutarate ferredoxin oxidoreductase subunit alpha